MSKEVIINMRNPNALIAMACVENNSNNPYLVFGEYIKYCLFSNPNVSTTFAQIKESVAVEFGIHIPGEIIKYCIQTLQIEKLVSVNNGVITCIGNYDTNKFEDKREAYRQTEKNVIDALILFAKKYNKQWSEEEAREYLLQVLDGDGLAYDIFIKDDGKENFESSELKELYLEDEATFANENQSDDEQPLFSNRNLVGRFINETMKKDTITKEYLCKICEGIMICVGAYQIPSNGTENVRPNIKNTIFLFDTKLLLRVLGVGSNNSVESAKELYDIILKFGGKIRYYQHNFKEMQDAFFKAITALKNNDTVPDGDMRAYLRQEKYKISVLEAKKACLKDELDSLKIKMMQNKEYDETDRVKYAFELNDFKVYMQNRLSERDPKGVDNDATSIWETHMLRKSNYEAYFGTSKNLSVFVTTNKGLCDIALKYHADRENTTGVKEWRVNRLPVITAMKVMCRLWSPSDSSKNWPLMYLSANAYAAQQPTRKYMNKVREIAKQIEKSVPEFSTISLTEFFSDNIIDSIFEKTEGGTKELEMGMFVDTLEDVSLEEARKQKELTAIAEKERDEERRINLNQQEAIIYDAVNRNKNTMDPKDKLKVKLIFLWEWLVIAITALIAYLMPDIGSVINIKTKMLLVGVVVLVAMAEKFFASNAIAVWFLKKCYPNIKASYERKIIKNLGMADKKYYTEIVEKVFAADKLIQQCENIIKEK